MDAERNFNDFSLAVDAYGFTIFYHGVPILRRYSIMKEQLLPAEVEYRTGVNRRLANGLIKCILRGENCPALTRVGMIDSGYQPSEAVVQAVLRG